MDSDSESDDAITSYSPGLRSQHNQVVRSTYTQSSDSSTFTGIEIAGTWYPFYEIKRTPAAAADHAHTITREAPDTPDTLSDGQASTTEYSASSISPRLAAAQLVVASQAASSVGSRSTTMHPVRSEDLDSWDPPLFSAVLKSLDKIDSLIYYRYGFKLKPNVYRRDLALQRPRGSVTWDNTCSTLGDSETTWEATHEDPIMDFVTYFLTGAAIPAKLCDLSDMHLSRVMCDTPLMIVRRCTVGDEVYYRIIPKVDHSANAPEPHWDLVVQDAITALECLRRFCGMGRIGIARIFLATGRAFTTQAPISGTRASILRNAQRRQGCVGLSWRTPAEGYSVTNTDYPKYQGLLRNWLGTERRARAAFLKGGIVWRLCIEFIDVDAALLGPGDIDTGCYTQFDGEDTGSWDDTLSEDDLDLISGVYKLSTGSGTQTADASWWPRHSAWASGAWRWVLVAELRDFVSAKTR